MGDLGGGAARGTRDGVVHGAAGVGLAVDKVAHALETERVAAREQARLVLALVREGLEADHALARNQECCRVHGCVCVSVQRRERKKEKKRREEKKSSHSLTVGATD